MLPRGVLVALTILIGLVWAGNVIVGFVDPTLRDPLINGIFGIVVGSLFALGRRDHQESRDRTPEVTGRDAQGGDDS